MRGVSAPERRYVITFGCPDRTGIIARISGFLAEHGGWIVEAAYHTDPDTGWFFTRQVVRADSLPFSSDLRFPVFVFPIGIPHSAFRNQCSPPRYAHSAECRGTRGIRHSP